LQDRARLCSSGFTPLLFLAASPAQAGLRRHSQEWLCYRSSGVAPLALSVALALLPVRLFACKIAQDFVAAALRRCYFLPRVRRRLACAATALANKKGGDFSPPEFQWDWTHLPSSFRVAQISLLGLQSSFHLANASSTPTGSTLQNASATHRFSYIVVTSQ
jgi:hypothetical protein